MQILTAPMRLLCANARLTAFMVILLLLPLASPGEESAAKESAELTDRISSSVRRTLPARAFPGAELDGGRRIEYLGVFSPEGKYEKLTRWRRFSELHTNRSFVEQQYDVPENVRLRSSERVVYDNLPMTRSAEPVQGHTWLGDVRDAAAGLAFGSERVLRGPTHVVTDSRKRLIITDPAATAVHVLDPHGNDSFRIVGGKGRRLQNPASVALDGEDNIYVADCERGMVLVYGADGRFRRYIGDYKGENLFQCPSAVALDRSAGRLYVLDTPEHSLYVMDLQGRVIKRVGKRGGGNKPGEFSRPTEVVLADHKLAVVDSDGTRVQLFDLQGRLLTAFRPKVIDHAAATKVSGVASDEEGNLFITFANTATIYVFAQDGRLLSSFGIAGTRLGEFRSPTGMWVDSANRIYVADTSNLRVQVFQLTEKR